MQPDDRNRNTLRTRIYIDGYNLYYGCLKNTTYKWLDLEKLFFGKILPSIMIEEGGIKYSSSPAEKCLKYFTATIIEKAAKSLDSVSSQASYKRALSIHSEECIEIIQGYYSLTKAAARIIDAENPEKYPRDCHQLQAWKLEEKQTDVNIAMHAYHDAIHDNVDHIVFVTNDTDIVASLNFIRNYTDKKIGLITPSLENNRQTNNYLSDLAHWVRRDIKEDELRDSQLPLVIPSRRKPVTKPDSWYPNSDIFVQILDTLKSTKGSRSKAFQWLNQERGELDGQIPLEMIEKRSGAEQVLHFVKAEYFSMKS